MKGIVVFIVVAVDDISHTYALLIDRSIDYSIHPP